MYLRIPSWKHFICFGQILLAGARKDRSIPFPRPSATRAIKGVYLQKDNELLSPLEEFFG